VPLDLRSQCVVELPLALGSLPLDLFPLGDVVTWVAAEYFPIELGVLGSSLRYGVPGLCGKRVKQLILCHSKVLLPQFHPQLLGRLRHDHHRAVHFALHKVVSSADDCHLGVAVPQQAPVVDVGRPAQHDLIVDDHQLGVHVDHFRLGVRVRSAFPVRAQAEELDVLGGIVGVVEEPMAKGVVSPADGIVLPLHGLPQQSAVLVLELPRKARQQGQDNIDHEPFTVLYGLPDSKVKGLRDLVLDDLAVGQRRDEELVFDVDVVLGLRDELQVGDVDGELRVGGVAPDRPVSHRPHDLALVTALAAPAPVLASTNCACFIVAVDLHDAALVAASLFGRFQP
jgi:hypothetical protein